MGQRDALKTSTYGRICSQQLHHAVLAKIKHGAFANVSPRQRYSILDTLLKGGDGCSEITYQDLQSLRWKKH